MHDCVQLHFTSRDTDEIKHLQYLTAYASEFDFLRKHLGCIRVQQSTSNVLNALMQDDYYQLIIGAQFVPFQNILMKNILITNTQMWKQSAYISVIGCYGQHIFC